MTKDPIGKVARAVGLSARDVARIIANAPQRYRMYPIEKRSGSGTRLIAQPSKPLKLVQRYLVREYLAKLKISESAHAYRGGMGIGTNAAAHAKSRVVMKMDFRNFFHSIVPLDLLSRLPEDLRADRTLCRIFELSLFWFDPNAKRLCLAIGAPSSPIVSNCVMYEFDEAVAKCVNAVGVKYTRYADDLTFSGDTIEVLEGVERQIRNLLVEARSPTLMLNEEKRGIFTRGMKRMITGVKITPSGEVSLGRERKRMISSFVFRAKSGMLSKTDIGIVRGWLAFANSIEPQFLDRLRKKYGAVVDAILRQPVDYRTGKSR